MPRPPTWHAHSAAVPNTDPLSHRVLLVTLLHRYLNQTRYTATFGRVYRSPDNNWGVIGAVRDFARRHGVPVHVTWMLDCYSYPAWYIVKPEAPVA